MGDFEDRLSDALADGAESAPGVGGLAVAARRRASVRRRRRVSLAAAVAVVVAAVPVGVLAADRSDTDRRPSESDTTPATVEWTTVSAMGVDLDLPAALASSGTADCIPDVAGWASPSADRCSWAVTVSPAAKQLRTGMSRSGLTADETSGYVDVGDAVVSVTDRAGLDRATSRRILASARPAGTPAPDVERWESRAVGDGFVVDVPVGGAVEIEVPTGDRRCAGSGSSSAVLRDDDRWAVSLCTGRRSYLVGPTQAVLDVAAASFREGTVDGWTTLTVADVSLDVPPGWRHVECGVVSDMVVPAGGSCRPSGPRVQLLGTNTFDGTAHSLAETDGAVIEGTRAVSVEDAPHETVRRILASVRPVGTPAPDVVEWETVDVGGGFETDVPVGDVVQVKGEGGDFDCNPGPGNGSSQQNDGRWMAGYCADQYSVTVTGPTRALTDVVTLSVRPVAEPEGWVTLTVDGVSIDAPPGWRHVECGGLDRLVAEGPTCGEDVPRVILTGEAATRHGDPSLADGLGLVVSGSQVITVDGVPFGTARRILASARPVGAVVPDLAAWEGVGVGEVYLAEVPVGGAVEVSLSEADVDCVHPGGPSRAYQREDGRWAAGYCGDRFVDVVGPTQALTDLVALSVHERERDPDDVEEWTTMSVGGVAVDVPSDWSDVAGCSFGAGGGSIQPPGSDVCEGRIPGVVVSKTIDATWTPPGVGARQGWVFVGTQTVGVDGLPTATRRRILASARPVGTDPPDVAAWRTVRLEDGITAVVPGDPAVEVTVSGAIASCTGDLALARPAAYGRWQVGLCGDRIVTVTAPTQALADLVASQVEGY